MSGIGNLMMEVTPELLLRAYACGIFPMSESADDPGLFWVEPALRGILPLDAVHVPRRLARTVRSGRFEVTVNGDFRGVIESCAEAATDRPETWINGRIRELYTALHDDGHAHSVETRIDGRLVGGLYGVSLGAAFFGESMFTRETDASKVALVHLVERLRAGGYRLLDTQFLTAHLQRFGAIEVSRQHYMRLLEDAVGSDADFGALDAG